MQLSALFEVKFRKTQLGGDREIKVSEQMGESSGGGKMARESIILTPLDGNREEAIVVGWMDVGNSAAEIRNFNTIASRYAQRFNKDIDIDPVAYKAFLDEAAGFFQQEGIQTTIVDSPPPEPRGNGKPAKSGGGNLGLWIALGLFFMFGGLVVLGVIAWFLFGSSPV